MLWLTWNWNRGKSSLILCSILDRKQYTVGNPLISVFYHFCEVFINSQKRTNCFRKKQIKGNTEWELVLDWQPNLKIVSVLDPIKSVRATLWWNYPTPTWVVDFTLYCRAFRVLRHRKQYWQGFTWDVCFVNSYMCRSKTKFLTSTWRESARFCFNYNSYGSML